MHRSRKKEVLWWRRFPITVFEKSLVGTGLVAHLLYAKFVMHLPIDRLLKEMVREKMQVDNTSTIYNWVKMGIQRLEILYEYKLQKLIHKKYLQVDETTLRMLVHTAWTKLTHLSGPIPGLKTS